MWVWVWMIGGMVFDCSSGLVYHHVCDSRVPQNSAAKWRSLKCIT